jgi:hypothetical protein
MRLYRVFPWLPEAREGDPGHALYVPTPGGAGRADNPLHYRALYFSDSPAAAVAEAFGTLKLWSPQMFVRPDLPGSVRTLAEYELPDGANAIFDLDDASALASLGVRPSQVVTRDRRVTQRWALEVFEQGKWAGSGGGPGTIRTGTPTRSGRSRPSS